MSDMSIPGASSKYNVDKMIENLMKVEKRPLEKLENQVETFNTVKSSWLQLDKTLKDFRNATSLLYGLDNPFNNKNFSSSNEQYVTGIAGKTAIHQDFTVKVNKTAQSDKLASTAIASNALVKEGKYTFAAGEKQISFFYRGGSFEDFASRINSRGANHISARVIQTTATDKTFIIESKVSGKENRLIFQDDALDFALENNLIKKNSDANLVPSFKDDNFFSQEHQALLLSPNSKKTFNLNNFDFSQDSTINITLKVLNQNKINEFKGDPSGPQISHPGDITYKHINIENELSDINQIKIDENLIPKEIIDNKFLKIQTRLKTFNYDEITLENQEIHLSLKVADLEGGIEALIFENNNTSRDLLIADISIEDPYAKSEYLAVNPISVASDAEFEYEGIKITRPSNKVDDLIAGVTINLERAGGESKISITPDKESVKEAIYNFIIEYNSFLDTATLLTSEQEDTLDKLNYLYYGFSHADIEKFKEANKEKLGILRGDTTIMRIRNTLRQALYEPYNVSKDNPYNLLSQIGISTNESGFQGYSTDSMLGYLQVNDKRLEEVLENNMEYVKELFGYDSNDDLVVDTGVAYKLNALIAPYTQTSGIISNTIARYDRQIKDTKTNITNMEKSLEAKEADYKRKYYQMEGLMEEIQKSSEALKNFSNQNN